MSGSKKHNHEVVETENHYKLCPACGNFCHENEKQIYCIACGTKMLTECPECKEPILFPTAKHCHKCGANYQKQ